MEKTILITGKEIPLGEALGEAARKTGRNLVITYEGIKTSKEDTTKIKKYPSGKTVETLWNRGSNAGARTVLVEAERLFHKIDETLLVFDADYYSQVFRDLTSTGCAKIIDNLIAGFIYLTWELTKRYAVQNAGTLVFILKAKKNSYGNIPLSAALGAFEKLAEETGEISREENWKVHLFRIQDEFSENGCNKLFQFLDTPKNKPNFKWNRISSKEKFFF